MSVREQVPKSLRGPVGLASLGVGVIFIVVGYIVGMLGLTLTIGLQGLGDALTTGDSLVVLAIGVGAIVVGYAGWRGFLYFSY